MYRKFSLGELEKIFNLNVVGKDVLIDGLGLCNRCSEQFSILSYITSEAYLHYVVANDKIKVLILSSQLYSECLKSSCFSSELTYIIDDFPEDLFYKIHIYLAQETDFYQSYDFPVKIGDNCNIHPTAILEDGVILGDNINIGAYSVIKRGTVIGDGSSIGINTIVGSLGFQALKNHLGKTYNVVHVGGVQIGKNVFIGDQVTICNSLFEKFVSIGDNCLIDSHSHVAHDCFVGHNCRLAAGVILFGSSVVKHDSWLSPGVMVMNKVTIADNCFVCPNSFVAHNTLSETKYIGSPAMTMDEYIKREKIILKLLLNKK